MPFFMDLAFIGPIGSKLSLIRASFTLCPSFAVPCSPWPVVVFRCPPSFLLQILAMTRAQTTPQSPPAQTNTLPSDRSNIAEMGEADGPTDGLWRRGYRVASRLKPSLLRTASALDRPAQITEKTFQRLGCTILRRWNRGFRGRCPPPNVDHIAASAQ